MTTVVGGAARKGAALPCGSHLLASISRLQRSPASSMRGTIT